MTEIWIKSPSILLSKKQINKIWPTKDMTRNEKLNAITRLVILLSILGYFVTHSYNFFITGGVTLAVITILYYIQESKSEVPLQDKVEGFTNPKVYEALKTNFTNPTVKNPAMNVLLPEISANPTRKSAAPAYNRAVEKQINDKTEEFVGEEFGGDKRIKDKLFSTLGDSLEFENFAQHSFYATPNTQIPNDQHGFAEFCYGDMVSAKEGNEFALTRNHPRLGSVIN
jgi:hypothetical protein